MTRRPHFAAFDRLRNKALAVGAVALVVCLALAFANPAAFFRAYLCAYLYYLGLALGALVILMIYHLTGGAWGFLIRRVLEAAVETLAPLAILFIPIAFGLDYIYPWAPPAGSELLHEEVRKWYLNPQWFWIHAVLFFALWLILAYFLNHWSHLQDKTGDPRYANRLVMLSGPGLVVHGLLITFAAVDWVMSLEPAFHSTIFGPFVASSQILSAHALGILVLYRLAAETEVAELVTPDALNDLGNLLLTFVVFWTYLMFFQFMLIWIANLPTDVLWYLPVMTGGWPAVTWALVILGFVIPFSLLLSRDLKRNPRMLARLAGLVLFMQLVFNFYQIMPRFSDTYLRDHVIDFLTPLGLGGVWLAYFLWRLKQYPLLPLHDANREAVAHLQAHEREEASHREEARHA